MTTFAVTYLYDDRAGRRDEVRPEHRAFLRSLLDTGVLLASGPWAGPAVRSDPPTEDGAAPAAASPAAAAGAGDDRPGALLLVRAGTVQDVTAALDGDPFWREGLVAGRTVREWDPVIGPWAGQDVTAS